MPRALPALLACLCAALALPAPAAAQVRRCVDAQGNSVFTDRSCASVDAAPRETPAPAPEAGTYTPGFARRGCARTPDQLLAGVRGALEAHDVNRLANFYHWPGTGNGAAKGLMDALEAVAARPLVAVSLVRPTAFDDGDSDAPLPDPTETPAPDTQPAPTALRVDQMAGPGDVSSRSTLFALRQHAGCWWVEF
ncbi:MAG: DUF4124 domain-containing protein [Arenimonas sp.]|nr:DUF4124 domain-containing protein [Arenimonas sp.]